MNNYLRKLILGQGENIGLNFKKKKIQMEKEEKKIFKQIEYAFEIQRLSVSFISPLPPKFLFKPPTGTSENWSSLHGTSIPCLRLFLPLTEF